MVLDCINFCYVLHGRMFIMLLNRFLWVTNRTSFLVRLIKIQGLKNCTQSVGLEDKLPLTKWGREAQSAQVLHSCLQPGLVLLPVRAARCLHGADGPLLVRAGVPPPHPVCQSGRAGCCLWPAGPWSSLQVLQGTAGSTALTSQHLCTPSSSQGFPLLDKLVFFAQFVCRGISMVIAKRWDRWWGVCSTVLREGVTFLGCASGIHVPLLRLCSNEVSHDVTTDQPAGAARGKQVKQPLGCAGSNVHGTWQLRVQTAGCCRAHPALECAVESHYFLDWSTIFILNPTSFIPRNSALCLTSLEGFSVQCDC